jgi:hypothetical protein
MNLLDESSDHELDSGQSNKGNGSAVAAPTVLGKAPTAIDPGDCEIFVQIGLFLFRDPIAKTVFQTIPNK